MMEGLSELKRRKTEREKILEEAMHCVCGDRDTEYGEPEDNFETVGKLWTVFLESSRFEMHLPDPISSEEVADMMVLFKVARATKSRSRDNYVDMAGYAACAGEINERDKGDD